VGIWSLRIRSLYKQKTTKVSERKVYYIRVPDTFSDTHPEIAKIHRDMLRKTSPARRLEMMGQLSQTVKELALAGLRSRYPHASPQLIHRRRAVQF
jgi:hypothetical protein